MFAFAVGAGVVLVCVVGADVFVVVRGGHVMCFAVFAMLRYRTNPIPIKEMTYLFIVITVGVINALSGNMISLGALLFTNFSIVLLTFILENYWQNNLLINRTIDYENIENIKMKRTKSSLSLACLPPP